MNESSATSESILNFPRLVGIHGKAGSGKDTVAQYLHSTRPNTWCEAFADPLKKACAALFGVDIDAFYEQDLKEKPTIWGVTPREILQYIGTDVVRNQFKHLLGENYSTHFWVDRLVNKLHGVDNSGVKYTSDDVVVITDVRFQNEYDYIIQNHGIIIHLTRPGYDGKVGIPGHSSEYDLRLYNEEKTYAIMNDSSLDELFAKVDNVINSTTLYPQTQTDNLFGATF